MVYIFTISIVYHFSIVFNRFFKKCMNCRNFVNCNKKIYFFKVVDGKNNIITPFWGIILGVIRC